MKDLDIIGELVQADHYYKEYYHILRTNFDRKTIEVLGWKFRDEDYGKFENWCQKLELEEGEYLTIKYLQIPDHPSSTAPYFLREEEFPLSHVVLFPISATN